MELQYRKHCNTTKMWFMYILSWAAMVIQICFVTLAVGEFCVHCWLHNLALEVSHGLRKYWCIRGDMKEVCKILMNRYLKYDI